MTVITTDLLSIEQIRWQLTTSTVGRVLHLLGSVDSTNARCRTLARAGAPEGTVVLAEEQSAGRGRRGRTWFSPSGLNLYASVLLRPPIGARELPLFSLLASLALVDAFEEHGAQAGLKWPNDILVDGKKVAGTLVESSMRGEQVEYAVLGVGANLNVESEVLRAVLGPIGAFATSLAAVSGYPVDRNAFAAAFLNRLDAWLEVWRARGPEGLRAAWAERDVLMDRHVEVSSNGVCLYARALGLDVGGGLLVQDAFGRRHTLVSEEVRPL
ncbi:MAG: biotin--[acetyl-CoA-carboxylase] ligase [Candidatus Rokuibacteriota bacterium]